MSEVLGIHMTAEFHGPVVFDDAWIERLYMSLDSNVAIVSKDLLFDEGARTLNAFFGVECPEGLDAESLVEGVAEDAIDRAIRFANNDQVATAALPILTPGAVEVFA